MMIEILFFIQVPEGLSYSSFQQVIERVWDQLYQNYLLTNLINAIDIRYLFGQFQLCPVENKLDNMVDLIENEMNGVNVENSNNTIDRVNVFKELGELGDLKELEDLENLGNVDLVGMSGDVNVEIPSVREEVSSFLPPLSKSQRGTLFKETQRQEARGGESQT